MLWVCIRFKVIVFNILLSVSNIYKVIVKSISNNFPVRDILIIYQENNIFYRVLIILLNNYVFNNVP